MKVAALIALAAFVTSAPAVLAQSGDMKGMDMKGMDMGKKPAAGAQTAHKVTAVVKKVDPKTGTVTLAHDPVKSLNWPAMTMGFTVKDKAMLGKLAVDKKVEVEFVQEGKDNIITSIK